jgi:hypothetical protein
MNNQILTDKLLDLTYHHSDAIAAQWLKSVSTNPRTPSFHSLSPLIKEKLTLQVKNIYHSLKKLFFTEHPYEETESLLETTGFIQDAYSQGIPVSEAVYALILMRRHIWLFADMQAMINTSLDCYLIVESINRTLLLFDYAEYIALMKYQQMAKKEKPAGNERRPHSSQIKIPA